MQNYFPAPNAVTAVKDSAEHTLPKQTLSPLRTILVSRDPNCWNGTVFYPAIGTFWRRAKTVIASSSIGTAVFTP
jgi:hypothetical protein